MAKDKVTAGTPELGLPTTNPTVVADAVTGEKTPANGKKRTLKVRKASPEIKAMNRIEAILEELDPETAARVARYSNEKAQQRWHEYTINKPPF